MTDKTPEDKNPEDRTPEKSVDWDKTPELIFRGWTNPEKFVKIFLCIYAENASFRQHVLRWCK